MIIRALMDKLRIAKYTNGILWKCLQSGELNFPNLRFSKLKLTQGHSCSSWFKSRHSSRAQVPLRH